MKILALLPLFSLAALQQADAQPLNPVKWSFRVEKVKNMEYQLIMTATIQPGWYLYSQFVAEGGPVPTTLTVNETPGLELVGKATEEGNKKQGFDDIFGMEITKFSGQAKFVQAFKVKEGVRQISGNVLFMTCDNERCLPPTTREFAIELP